MIIKIITATFLLLAIGYFIFRVVVRNNYLKRKKLSTLSSILEFVFFALHANAMYFYLPVKWPELPPLANNSVLFSLSIIAIIIGLVIVLLAIVPLGYKRAMGSESKALKTNGLYNFSRNPQLVGYGLVLIGFCLSYFAVLSIIWLIIYLIVARWMVQSEEEYLLNKYGTEYKKYCEKVPRYIGFINKITV
jgi:protein-S-isoprenylcysteine O-methyltransferase Ste14